MANIAYMNELQQQPPSWLRCSCNSWGCGVQATTDSASQHAHILWLGGGGGVQMDRQTLIALPALLKHATMQYLNSFKSKYSLTLRCWRQLLF